LFPPGCFAIRGLDRTTLYLFCLERDLKCPPPPLTAVRPCEETIHPGDSPPPGERPSPCPCSRALVDLAFSLYFSSFVVRAVSAYDRRDPAFFPNEKDYFRLSLESLRLMLSSPQMGRTPALKVKSSRNFLGLRKMLCSLLTATHFFSSFPFPLTQCPVKRHSVWSRSFRKKSPLGKEAECSPRWQREPAPRVMLFSRHSFFRTLSVIHYPPTAMPVAMKTHRFYRVYCRGS